jgi:GTP cyclohydrolase I
MGLRKMLHELGLNADHTLKTPERYIEAMHEFISGYKADPGPKTILETSFEETIYDQMIFVNDISFYSLCQHHLVPFAGKAHFGYIPNGKLVGLSKIPRIVDIFSKRLQIQEKLTHQIVDIFDEVIKPKGCGIVIEAVHMCVCARGVKKYGSWTRTAAMRGNFYDEKTKYEFLDGAKSKENSLL